MNQAFLPARNARPSNRHRCARRSIDAKALAFELLNLPPEQWQKRIEELHAQPVSAIGAFFGLSPTIALEQALGHILERAALLEAYVGRRYNAAGDECSHAKAAEHAHRKAVRIRRVMGYSMPAVLRVRIPAEAAAPSRVRS